MFDLASIVEEIISSKKYSFVYKPLVVRICKEEFPKYKKDKDRIKAIKSRLHILYGAYLGDECHKKAYQFINEHETSSHKDIYKTSESIMRLHASTNERIRNISEIYKIIFENVGKVASVLDIGCGFNPFSLPWIIQNNTTITDYFALDIDYRTSELINYYFKLLGMKQLAYNIDVVSESPRETADIAFLFKLIPLVEGQQKGRGFQLINEIKSKYIAVTYPLKSLSGKEKGMNINYSDSFENSINENFEICAKKIINNELLYIITKK